MKRNFTPRRKFSELLLVLGILSASGCSDSPVKRDPIAPSVAAEFAPSGHIQTKKSVESSIGEQIAIPSISAYQSMELPPISFENSEIYSITAVNVPVNELLFKIAQDANKEIDIYSGVEGSVTINAINQPLNEILTRISDQLNFVFEITKSTLVTDVTHFAEF